MSFNLQQAPGDRERVVGRDHALVLLGTVWIAGRAELSPVYRLIFERLKAAGAGWRYEGHVPTPRRARGMSRRKSPTPSTVRAYRRVYGRPAEGMIGG